MSLQVNLSIIGLWFILHCQELFGLSLSPYPEAVIRYGKPLQLTCQIGLDWIYAAWRKGAQGQDTYVFDFEPDKCGFKQFKNYSSTCKNSVITLLDPNPQNGDSWTCVRTLRNTVQESRQTRVHVLDPVVSTQNVTYVLYGDPARLLCVLDHGWDKSGWRRSGSSVFIIAVTPETCNNIVPQEGFSISCNGDEVTLTINNPLHGSVWECVGQYEDLFTFKPVNSTTVEIFAEQPSVMVTTSPTEAIEFYEFMIMCFASGRPKPSVHWTLDNEPLNNIVGENNSINFNSVNRSNSGTYTCSAISDFQGEKLRANATFVLQVQYPPTVQVDHETVNVGASTRISCKLQGYPKTFTITKWQHFFKKDFIRTIQQNNQLLLIPTVSHEDRGDYFCFATNGIPDRHGNTEQNATGSLRVTGPPVLIDTPQKYEVEAGEYLSANVRVYSDPELDNVDLRFKNSSVLITTTTKVPMEMEMHGIQITDFVFLTTCIFTNITGNQHGQYSLTVSNNVSRAQINFTVYVGESPVISLSRTPLNPTENFNFELQCSAYGRPVPLVKWFWNGTAIGNESGRIIFDKISRINNGTYKCRASSSFRGKLYTVEKETTVNVQYPPAVYVGNTTGYIGSNAKIICQANGNPDEIIITSWKHYYKDVWIRNIYNNDSSLLFSELSVADQGEYQCTATNGVPDKNGETKIKGTGTLEVKGKPFLIDFEKTFEILQNTDFSLELHAYSYPSLQNSYILKEYANQSNITVPSSWSKNTTSFLLHGKNVNLDIYKIEMHIKNVSLQSSGFYMVVVHNAISTEIYNFSLNVLEKPKIIIEVEPLMVVEHRRLKIICKSSPVMNSTTEWYIDGHLLSSSIPAEESLIYEKVLRNNSGLYLCRKIFNIVEQRIVQNATFNVTVLYPAEVKVNNKESEAGSTAKIECIYDGVPKTVKSIRWIQIFNDVEIRKINNNQSIFHIEKVSIEDQGRYTCLVSNGVLDIDGNNETKGSGNLIVRGPPVFVTKSTEFNISLEEQSIDLCDIYSLPPFQEVILYENKTRIILSNIEYEKGEAEYKFHGKPVRLLTERIKWHLNNITKSDGGSYVLHVANNISSIQMMFTIHLNSFYRSNSTKISDDDEELKMIIFFGLRIVLPCVAVIICVIVGMVIWYSCRRTKDNKESEGDNGTEMHESRYEDTPVYDEIDGVEAVTKQQQMKEQGDTNEATASNDTTFNGATEYETPLNQGNKHCMSYVQGYVNSIGFDG